MLLKHPKRLLLSLIIIALISFSWLFNSVSSQGSVPWENASVVSSRVPSTLTFSYQGLLTSNNGTPINHSGLPMTIALFRTLIGGTACEGWTEGHTVAVENGRFNLLIGQSGDMPDACLVDDIFIELTVDGEVLSPREKFSPFASTLPHGSQVGRLLVESGVDGEGGEVYLLPGTTGNGWVIDNRFGNFRLHHSGSEYFRMQPDGDLILHGLVELNGNKMTGIGAGDVEMEIGRTSNDGNMYFDLLEGDTFAFRDLTDSTSRLWLSIREQNIRIYDNDLLVEGNITANSLNVGSCLLSSTGDALATASNTECTSGTIATGGIVELNLQTPHERLANGNPNFELGDLLCWGEMQLELCSEEASALVQAVADVNGNPVIVGQSL